MYNIAANYDQLDLTVDPVEASRKPVSGGWVLFIAVWLFCIGIGISVAVFAKLVILGVVIMAIPTTIGIFASPVFALSCIALVLPLSGSINFQGVFTADRAVGGLAAIGILFHCRFMDGRLSIKGSPLKPMFILSVLATLSALWAPNHLFAFVSSLTILQLSVWSLAVWNAVAYKRDFIWPMRCYVTGMLVVVMRLYLTGGLSRFANAVGVASRLTLEGTNNNEINPNDFAEFLAGGFFFAVYLFLRDPVKILRLFWMGCAFVFPAMMLMTGARSCLVGLGAALALTVFTLHTFLRSRGMIVGVAVSACLLLVAVNVVFNSRFAKTEAIQRLVDTRKRERSVGNRVMLMQHGIKNIIRHPVLGSGYKNYTIAYNEHWAIHNDLMLMTAEVGLLGGVLLLWWFGNGFFAAFKTRAPAEKWLVRSSFVFFVVTGLAHPCFANKAFWFFPIFSAAIAYRARLLEEEQDRIHLAPASYDAMPAQWRPVYSHTPNYG